MEPAADNELPVVIIDSGVQNELVSAACATNNYTAGAAVSYTHLDVYKRQRRDMDIGRASQYE